MSLFLNIITKTVFARLFFKKLHILMFDNWKGIKPMGISAS